ncbi:MAG: hypothetical protein RLY16_1420 [Bacteroidota bacterium]|jgi:hypothetical protein
MPQCVIITQPITYQLQRIASILLQFKLFAIGIFTHLKIRKYSLKNCVLKIVDSDFTHHLLFRLFLQ